MSPIRISAVSFHPWWDGDHALLRKNARFLPTGHYMYENDNINEMHF